MDILVWRQEASDAFWSDPTCLERSRSPLDLDVPPAPSYPPPSTPEKPSASSAQILQYQNWILFLKGVCEIMQYSSCSLVTDLTTTGFAEGLEVRKNLLEFSANLDLENNPDLLNALRADDKRITGLLVSLFYSQSAEDAVLSLQGNSAQIFLDVVQDALDRGLFGVQEHIWKARRIIRKLSEACELLPSALFIAGVSEREDHPTFGGGYGDIYRASYGSEVVALKHLRHFLRGSGQRRVRLKFCREALVWRDLHHPNILGFRGIDRESFPSSLCMVSPWMEHGTVLNYLKHHGRYNVDNLLYEIAQGLQYLHCCNIVHGDLRGANILINQDHSACLADFGLSVFSNATSATRTSTRAGSLNWLAPELIDPDRFGHRFARTPATDVYAFGCVCIELYTGRPPFSDLSEAAALLKIVNGEREERPTGNPAMSDALWQQVAVCWAENPEIRPTIQSVVNNMAELPWTRPNNSLRRLPPLPGSAETCNSWTPHELFQACKIAVGTATLLNEALVMTTPEDLGNTLITELYEVCTKFQKHISIQIPRALARSERIREKREKEARRKPGNSEILLTGRLAHEEELLSSLFSANEELLEVFRVYKDLRCLAMEQEKNRMPANNELGATFLIPA